ncbi:MAG: glycosyltransferase family 2 protein [Flavobacterium sp.]|nr:glycosyltransferase family 2 protein [Flavobacterium sp.]
MQLSVIILNYNVRYFLEQCVRSVQAALHGIEAEIIVVDNASADDSCAMMQQLFPEVLLIQNTENIGFTKGNNIGVAQAQGEFICILNPDTVVAEDTFSKLLAFAQNKSQLGMVGCQLIDGSGQFLPESKRGIPTPWVAFTKITGLYKFFPSWSIFTRYYAQQLLPRFDEHCFMYADDIDLSYCLLKKGYTNWYFAETSVIHYKGESTLRDHKYMRRFQEAMEFFYQKHFGKSFFSWFFILGLRMGAFLFSLQKKQQAVSTTNSISSYVLVSNQETLRKTLADKLQATVIRTEDVHTQLGQAHQEVIFDADFISNKACIAQMKHLSKAGLTFKIKPKNARFILGSNHSNDRGSVVSW